MKQSRNTWFAAGLAAVIAGMVGMAFASVPLYKAFCEATGYGGTPNTSAQAAPGAVKRMITVDFTANVNPGLPWAFKPEQDKITLPMGQDQVAYYEAHNNGTTAIKGVALYNVTPDKVGKYFHKTACFCFNEQTLTPGQEQQFPLSFWVDPAIADDPSTADVTTITLSYTFFRAADDPAFIAAAAHAGPHVGPLVR
jgi:cytochrome c oxidase assembly protein subunit 11